MADLSIPDLEIAVCQRLGIARSYRSRRHCPGRPSLYYPSVAGPAFNLVVEALAERGYGFGWLPERASRGDRPHPAIGRPHPAIGWVEAHGGRIGPCAFGETYREAVCRAVLEAIPEEPSS